MVDRRRNVVLVTGGHPFEREPFLEMFEAMPDVDFTHVEQPEAQALFTVDEGARFDAYVLYDMPGIEFQPDGPRFIEPPAAYRSAFLELVEAGHGFVFLHHAIAGWPLWEPYGQLIGGRFLYVPGELRGKACLDSGYRHEVTHTVSRIGTHPMTSDLPDSFEITDELYLFPVLEDSVVPLMRSTFEFTDDHFYSADLAIRGTRNSNEGWSHPPGSDLVVWVKHAANSPVAYIQFADGPVTYADANYRRIVDNAIG